MRVMRANESKVSDSKFVLFNLPPSIYEADRSANSHDRARREMTAGGYL